MYLCQTIAASLHSLVQFSCCWLTHKQRHFTPFLQLDPACKPSRIFTHTYPSIFFPFFSYKVWYGSWLKTSKCCVRWRLLNWETTDCCLIVTRRNEPQQCVCTEKLAYAGGCWKRQQGTSAYLLLPGLKCNEHSVCRLFYPFCLGAAVRGL